MITGQRPFQGDGVMAILSSLAIDTPVEPHVLNRQCSLELSSLVMRLLEKEPAKRPESAAAVIDALAKMFADVPLATPVLVDQTAVTDPWAGIDEPNQTAALAKSASAPTDRAIRKPRWRFAIAVAAMVLLLVGGSLTAYKLVFETKDGTLVVEVANDAEVRFKNGELQVYGEDGKLKYTLKPNERSKTMPPGKYSVQVVSPDGVKLDTDKFEMSKDGKVVLRVTAQPMVVMKDNQKIDATIDPDRRAAEYVLSVGGAISIRINDADSDQGINAVASLPKEPFRLTSVAFRSVKANVKDSAPFKDCKSLTGLDVEQTLDADAWLALFKGCTNLTHLWLALTGVTDRGLAHLKDCKNLTSVTISDAVTDAGLAHLNGCKNLTVLSLAYVQVTDKGLRNWIVDSKNLEVLRLADTLVTDEGLTAFKDCKKLQSLSLGGKLITDKGLANFKDHTDLRSLHLRLNELTDEGLANFKNCKNLSSLDLASSRVTDAGLAHFKDSDLNTLDLMGVNVSEMGLATNVIKDSKTLQRIGLHSLRVTDASLENLARLPSLVELDVRNCRISRRGLEQLKTAMPLCQFAWSEPNRTAAEQVLALGGTVQIAAPVRKLGQLSPPMACPRSTFRFVKSFCAMSRNRSTTCSQRWPS